MRHTNFAQTYKDFDCENPNDCVNDAIPNPMSGLPKVKVFPLRKDIMDALGMNCAYVFYALCTLIETGPVDKLGYAHLSLKQIHKVAYHLTIPTIWKCIQTLWGYDIIYVAPNWDDKGLKKTGPKHYQVNNPSMWTI